MASPLKTRIVRAILGRHDGFKIEFFKQPYHHYKIDGEKVVSVTQALGVLDKSGPLVGWATKIDVEAARRLATEPNWYRCTARGCVQQFAPVWKPRTNEWPSCDGCDGCLGEYTLPDAGWKLQQDIKRAGIGHDSVVADAQFRGTAIHKLHEDWVDERKIPTLTDYPEAWRGYVQSYARFLMAHGDVEFEVAEVLVGSKRHGFAGTCDTVAVTTGPDGRRTRLDFKTSKAIYPSSHFPQLAGYEVGAVECGDAPTDRQGIVRLGGDGTFEIGYSTATDEDFLVLLAAFKSQQPFKAAEAKAYRARKKESK